MFYFEQRIMNDMKQPEHAMLWNGLFTRNFDEFWTINRKLMDPDGNKSGPSTSFKNLPIRLYKVDKTYSQPYISAPSEDNSSTLSTTTVSDLLKYLCVTLDERKRVLSQGIEIPLDSSLYELTRALSYPDNFLYLCVVDNCSTT